MPAIFFDLFLFLTLFLQHPLTSPNYAMPSCRIRKMCHLWRVFRFQRLFFVFGGYPAPLPYLPTPSPVSPALSHLPNMKNTPHGARTEQEKHECSVASLPPPVSANTPTYIPFPLPLAKHKNREHVHVFCVLWLACPSLQPPPSTGDARHTHVSPFPSPPLLYLPNTKNRPMWHVFCVWHCSTCLHLLKTKNTPSVARFSCSAPMQHPSRPLHPPSH